MPEAYWDPTANAPKADELKQIFESHAARAAAEAELPKEPAGYEIAPPKDYKLPDGRGIDPNHPLAEPLRAIAHKHHLPQTAVSELVQAQIEADVARGKVIADAQAAELKKLGPNATARVTAAKTFLAGVVGKDGAQQLIDRLVLAGDIELVEKLQLEFNPGGAHVPAGGREPPPPPEPAKTPAERMWPNGFGSPQARTS